MLAPITYAQAAAQALAAAMEADPAVVVLGEDVGRGGIFGQYAGLQARFGVQRVIDTPISEATIMGAGVGMALAGLKPVVEMRVVDFALCAMDEIVNQAAKNRFMFGGQGRVPLVARLPIGMWSASAAQHSQSLEGWFAHLPGVVVVCPSTVQDNHDLLRAALDCGDPVIYMEHKELWGLSATLHDTAAGGAGRGRALAPGRRSDAGQLVAADALGCRGRGHAGRPRRAGRPDRPAHAVAMGSRRGVHVGRAHRAAAGHARSGAGRRLRRRGRRDRGRNNRLPGAAARCAAHTGGLCNDTGRSGAGAPRSHRCRGAGADEVKTRGSVVPPALEEGLAVACMAVLLLITILNVLTRYFTAQSFAWSEEISVFLMVLMTLAGASAATARDRHIRIEFFYGGGSANRRQQLKIITACITALLFAVLALLFSRVVADEIRYEETSMGLGIPRWWFTIFSPLLCAAIALRSIGVAWSAAREVESNA